MLNKFQDKAQKVIALSESIAFELGQSSVGTEHLLLALLKQKDNKCRQLLEKEGIILENGLIAIDENGKTNIAQVYAGGDVTESKSTVCRAIAAGKRAAKGILEELQIINIELYKS